MPRVYYRKARKDYPNQGIEKGDMYYFTQLKLPRDGVVKRSLTPFKRSQLTNIPFKSGYMSVGEIWDEAHKDGQAMRDAAGAIREIGEACNESYENMPEGLQGGDTGQMLYVRAEQCESKAGELEGLADEFEALEDPGEFDPSDWSEEIWTMDPEDIGEFLSEKESEYEDEQSNFDSEMGRIVEEATDLIGDMPE